MEAIAGISLLLLTTFAVSAILRRFKQPLLIGYVVAGIIASRLVGIPSHYLSLMSEIGISFLLFIVGIHLSPRSLFSMGKDVVIVSVLQMAATFAASFALLSLLGASPIVSIAASFSSTIIAMKLLSDRNELRSLHGRMAIGILIMQDAAAIASLMLISHPSSISLVISRLAVVSLISVVLWHLVSRLDYVIAKSRDLLFLFSVAWVFSISTLFRFFGFSPEMGALVAGMLLSNSDYRYEISSRIKPLRDFFIIMFFIVVGSGIGVSGIPLAIALLFVSLVVKPAVFYFSMRALGYLKRPSLLASLSISQLSEFSIILASAAAKSGLVSGAEVSAISLATVVSMALTPYLLNIGERVRGSDSMKSSAEKEYDAILFGCNRIGHIILKSLKGRVAVVDFDPEVIDSLKGKVDAIYGDASDGAFLEEIGIGKAKMVISTIPDYEANLLILSKAGKNALKIVVSYDIEEAMDFYRNGASLVLMPHFLGGEYVASIISRHGFDISKYEEEREKHIRLLEEKKRMGHRHPSKD